MASSTSATHATGSTDIYCSDATLGDVDECVKLQMDVAWDNSAWKASLHKDTLIDKYKGHINWAFFQQFRKEMKRGFGNFKIIKAVQDGRIVGFLQAAQIDKRGPDQEEGHRTDSSRPELPEESLKKPIDQLGDDDRKNLVDWAVNGTLKYDQAGSIKDLEGILESYELYYHIDVVAVASEKQRQGIGRKLINDLRKHAGSQNAVILTVCQRGQEYFFRTCGLHFGGGEESESCGDLVCCYWMPGDKTG